MASQYPKTPWNKGKLLGQKRPFKRHNIWAIRIHLQLSGRIRDLALFNLAIDSKLRACDLVRLRVRNIAPDGQVASRALVLQQKTQRPVQFEITEQTRQTALDWINHARLNHWDFLFPAVLSGRPIYQRGSMQG